MRMFAYVVRRLLELLPVILMVILLNFALVHLAPSDPASVMAGEFGSREQIEMERAKWGLDKPFVVQLETYLSRVVQGDLGYSYFNNELVVQIIARAIPATLILVLTSHFIGLALGILVGTHAGVKRGSRVSQVFSLAPLFMYSMPVFWLGLVLMWLFAVNMHLFPAIGMTSLGSSKSGIDYVIDILRHMCLPVAALTASWTFPQYLRITRASVIEVMGENFVLAARAEGLAQRTIFFKHILRNALIPPVTMSGLWIGTGLTGAILTETVFAWPGVGLLAYQSILMRDYQVLMGIFIILSVTVVVASLVTDIICGYLDPRIRYR